MSSSVKEGNSGHYANYVGPYRLEKTLGKGQTAEGSVTVATGGMLSSVAGWRFAHSTFLQPLCSALEAYGWMVVGGHYPSAPAPFCCFEPFYDMRMLTWWTTQMVWALDECLPGRTDGPSVPARANELRRLEAASYVNPPIMWPTQKTRQES
ncbi:Serine/threonine-protein kinase BRSK2 [Channa argus]|uniref:Serine/threonine-protein kinase BRSK2 n=1 Tax=Channa argus TaxID=215402 RepID=A0A6G1P7G5_CHAAH|nr:Serine/threonine-protein kinase BRSK2 [Channa argus]